jgi:hypothetical protein
MIISPTREAPLIRTSETPEVLIEEARLRGRRQRLVAFLLVTTGVGITLGLVMTSGGSPSTGAGPFGAFGAGARSMAPATKAAFRVCESSLAGPGSGTSVLAAYPSTAGLLTSAARLANWYDPGRPSHYAGYPSSTPMTVCYLAGKFEPSTPPGMNVDWTRGVYVVPPPGGPATRHGITSIPLVIAGSHFKFVPPPTRI